MSIFVQIAAYRDTELGPTVRDCLAKAKRPEELRFGICLQDDLGSCYDLDFSDPRFRLIHVHWRESQGVCWARHQAFSLYEGEDFLLQIDSHHRFAEHWDELLLKDIEYCEASKPVLSTYPGSYDPETGRCALKVPNKILVSRFDHNGCIKRYPLGFKAKNNRRPIPARFVAAGFLFTLGQFCEDIPYDPEMYFAGEEPSLTLRSYTHGYDIFHPQQNILWHEYVRESKPKHWLDHTQSGNESTDKITESEPSDMDRFYRMLDRNGRSKLGLGSVRSVHDYERFAGLDLSNRVVHQEARLGMDPITISEKEWQANNEIATTERQRFKYWFTKIDFSDCLCALRKAKVGILTYYDRDNQMIDRVTIKRGAISDIGIFEQELESSAPPSFWILTGFTQNNSWEQIRSGRILDYRLMA